MNNIVNNFIDYFVFIHHYSLLWLGTRCIFFLLLFILVICVQKENTIKKKIQLIILSIIITPLSILVIDKIMYPFNDFEPRIGESLVLIDNKLEKKSIIINKIIIYKLPLSKKWSSTNNLKQITPVLVTTSKELIKQISKSISDVSSGNKNDVDLQYIYILIFETNKGKGYIQVYMNTFTCQIYPLYEQYGVVDGFFNTEFIELLKQIGLEK